MGGVAIASFAFSLAALDDEDIALDVALDLLLSSETTVRVLRWDALGGVVAIASFALSLAVRDGRLGGDAGVGGTWGWKEGTGEQGRV